MHRRKGCWNCKHWDAADERRLSSPCSECSKKGKSDTPELLKFDKWEEGWSMTTDNLYIAEKKHEKKKGGK
jgi:hypothetical protein